MKEEIGLKLAQLLREGIKLQKEAKAAQQRVNSLGYLDASKKTVYRSQKGSNSERGTAVIAMIFFYHKLKFLRSWFGIIIPFHVA